MAAFPRNPTLIDNEYREVGETRIHNEILECLYQGAWLPAVRQHTIRAELLHSADIYGSYIHPRPEDENGTNRTAYLHRDRSYGEQWVNLPPIIYELYPPKNRRAVKPKDVLRDARNRIMLDPYDHPIRDFPGELPIVISDKLRGVWVEYYLRSNREIKVYDLVARMGFVAKDKRPVRTARLTERATKFRKAAACSTWNEKTGSTQIRQAILSLLPPNATSTRSLGGYLSKSQLEILYSVNKGTFANRARKTAREARVPQGLAASQPTITIPSSTAVRSSDYRDADELATVPRDSRKRSRAQTSLDLAASETTAPHSKRSKYMQPQSSKRDAHTALLDETDAPFAGPTKRRKTSSGMGKAANPTTASERIIRQAKIPNATSKDSGSIDSITQHDRAALSDPADCSGEVKHPFTSPDNRVSPQLFSPSSHANSNSIKALHGSWLLHSSQQSTLPNNELSNDETTFISIQNQGKAEFRRRQAVQAKEHPATEDTDLPRLYPCIAQAQHYITSSETSKRPFTGRRQGPQNQFGMPLTRTNKVLIQADDLPATHGYLSDSYRPPSYALSNQSYDHTSYRETGNSQSYISDLLAQITRLPEDHDTIHHNSSGASTSGKHEGIANSTTIRSFSNSDPAQDDAFQAECMAGITRHDYRYYHPNLKNEDPEETESLQAALILTRIDFKVKTGHDYPAELIVNHQHESYATQHWHMQKHFEAIWHDPGLAPTLYRLEKDFFGWNGWSIVVDQLGQWLYDTAKKNGWIGEMGLWSMAMVKT